MALESITIVLFEDDEKTGPQLQQRILKKLKRKGDVSLFTPARKRMDRYPPYEDRLAAEVQTRKYHHATLWVTDRDLSRTPEYRGLSEAVVSKVAAQFGVPICKYARGTADDDVFERQRNWGDAQVILESSDLDALASEIAILANGFQTIAKKLDRLLHDKTGDVDVRTPADVMAHLLERPSDAGQIALYGSGDQKMVSEILPFADGATGRKELKARLPSLLGYWLYDSLLRFPGILMNSVAAASYLNISVATFEKPRVRRLFNAALYRGPFSDPVDPHWWRRDTDDLLLKAGASDGNEYAHTKLKIKIPPCLDGSRRAGLYCMVKKVPVSEENSVGNISWFPPGADLARVRKDVYDQMGPWLGLF
jgi:hypothetical protein